MKKSKESILAQIIRYAETHKESPTQNSHTEDKEFPSRFMIRLHFGTFKQAMIAAGIPLRPHGTANPRHRLHNSVTPRARQLWKNKGSLKRRFEILQRDNFSCRYCGRGVADGVKLEIDHVTPFSKGGDTIDDNLVTACSDCNRGKRDVLIEKHSLKTKTSTG